MTCWLDGDRLRDELDLDAPRDLALPLARLDGDRLRDELDALRDFALPLARPDTITLCKQNNGWSPTISADATRCCCKNRATHKPDRHVHLKAVFRGNTDQKMLKVDVRESALWSSLEGKAVARPMQRMALDLGDVWVESVPPESLDPAAPSVFVFERKTLADLAASIKDGRYREQKARLLTHYAPRRITYIIEGGGMRWLRAGSANGLAHSVYQGAVFHTLYRDGAHVVFTKDVDETADFLLAFAGKLAADPAKFDASGGAASPCVVALQGLKRCKMANIDAAACYRMQLCQLPHISSKIADAIATAYPSMPQLIAALQPLSPAARVAALVKLPLVGKKKAEAVIHMLWSEAASPLPAPTEE
jgi:ERCC4-type nuclease